MAPPPAYQSPCLAGVVSTWKVWTVAPGSPLSPLGPGGPGSPLGPAGPGTGLAATTGAGFFLATGFFVTVALVSAQPGGQSPARTGTQSIEAVSNQAALTEVARLSPSRSERTGQ